jgi:hypothetical protein
MATQKQIEAGRKARENSLKFEDEFVEDVQKEFGPRAAIKAAESTEGENVNYPSIISEKVGHTSKPDVFVFYNGLSDSMPAARELQKIYDSEVGVESTKSRLFSKSPELLEFLEDRQNWGAPSLKNPGKESSEIQMQITSLSNLIASVRARLGSLFEHRQALTALEIWIGVGKETESNGGALLTEEFQRMCEDHLVDYESLSDFEKSHGRVYSGTLSQDKFDALEKLVNDKAFRNALATVVFSEGIITPEEIEKHPELRADYMVWKPKNSSEYTVLSIADVIKAVVESEPAVINRTTVYLGPLQFQKKGSGMGTSYNNIQFNASLNGKRGLLKHVTPVAVCDSAEEAYLKMKEHVQTIGRFGELARKMELHRQTRPKTDAELAYQSLKVRA